MSFFLSQKCCADSLPVCPTPVCLRTHNYNHSTHVEDPVRSGPFQSLVDYGDTKTTQHALGLGLAALAKPNFPEFPESVLNKKSLIKSFYLLSLVYKNSGFFLS